ncbi:hypothetical protein QOT17_005427 [Balamuthia mandrillaris]
MEAVPPSSPPSPATWTTYRKAAIPSLQWLCMDAFADFLSSYGAANAKQEHEEEPQTVLLPDLLERLLSHWTQSNRLAEVLPCLFSSNLFVGPAQVHLDFSDRSALDASLLTAALSSEAPSLLASTAVRTIHLDLSECRQLLDEQVDAILRARTTQLCSLNLSHCEYLTDNGLRSLAHCSNLTSLSLAFVPIDSATIHLAAEYCTLLQHLDICNVKFTKCIIDDLGKLHELEVLLMDRTEMPNSHPEGLAHVFANCNKLRIVDLSNELLSDYQLAALASHCPSLERITIDSTEYKNVLLALRQSPCLREYMWDEGSCDGPLSAEYYFDPLEPSLCNLTKLSLYFVDLQPHVLPTIARCCTNLVSYSMDSCSFTAECMNDIPTQRESFVSILRNNVGLHAFRIRRGRINICLNEQVIKEIGPSCPNLRTLRLSLVDGTFVTLHSKSLEKLYITNARRVAFDINCPKLRLFSCTAFGMEPAQLDLWKTLLLHGSTLQKLDINTLLPEMLEELSKRWLFPLLRSLAVRSVAQHPLPRKHHFTDEECKYLDTFLQQRPHFCFASGNFVDVKDGELYPHLCQRLESTDVTFDGYQSSEPIVLNQFANLVTLNIMNTDHVTTAWIEALGTVTPKLVEFIGFNNHFLTSFRLRHHSLRSIRLIHWHKLVEFELDCPNLCQIQLDNCSLMSEHALTTLSDSSKNNVPSLVDLWCQHDSCGYAGPASRTLVPEEAIVIQSCPISVQHLSMERTWHVVELSLSCPNLRTFKLYDMEFLQVLRLDCPKLQSLHVDIAPRLNNVTLNLPALVQLVFWLAVPPPEEDEDDERKQHIYQQLLRKFVHYNGNELTTEEDKDGGAKDVFHLELLSSLPQLQTLSIQTLPAIDGDDDDDGSSSGSDEEEDEDEEEEEESEKPQRILFISHLPHYQALWHILERANGLLTLRVDVELLALAHPRWMQSLAEEDVIPSEMTSEEADEVVFERLRNACPKLWKLELIQACLESKRKPLRALYERARSLERHLRE